MDVEECDATKLNSSSDAGYPSIATQTLILRCRLDGRYKGKTPGSLRGLTVEMPYCGSQLVTKKAGAFI